MSQEEQNQNKKGSSKSRDKNGGSINFIFILLVLIGLLGAGLVLFSNRGKSQATPAISANPEALPGIQSSDAPWAAELSHLRERLTKIGLPALQEEGSALHIHQHLDIFIHGKQRDVPPGIGFNPMERFISPVHTHDGNGVIHIESPAVQKFTLGQFFDIWGVRFNSRWLGSYCEDQKNVIKTFINGIPREGDPRSIELSDHQVIVVTYGERSELPNPIPSQYQFPQGT